MITLKVKVANVLSGVCRDVICGDPRDFVSGQRICWRESKNRCHARADGAEYVLVYMHWGIDVEYKSEQSAAMMRMAQDVADCGADYIVGSHTHSLQPKSMVRSADGRDVPVIYSMGNFVTSEWNKISRKTAMLQIRLQKKDGKVVLLGDQVIPCMIPDRAFGAAYPIVPDALLQE